MVEDSIVLGLYVFMCDGIIYSRITTLEDGHTMLPMVSHNIDLEPALFTVINLVSEIIGN